MGSRKSMRTAILCAGVVFITTAMPQICAATTDVYEYGDFTAQDVIFEGVTEASVTDPVPLYGAPSVSLDSLLFDLAGVGAFGTAGGFDFIDVQLQTTIVAKSHRAITQLEIRENGDFSLFGSGTAATKVAVGVPAILRIREIDGAEITPIVVSKNMTITPSGTTNGQFDLVNSPGVGQLWSGLLAFDVDQIIQDAGMHGKATRVDLTFDNSLLATSESGSGAMIMKKMVDLGVITTVLVPEPGTLAMLFTVASGLGIFVWRKRRA